MRTDKNLDISTLITRGCFFGTYYLTASTLPLGLATTWWIWTLPTCFPTALCMCMVWWKCRYSQPGRFEWLCIDFFYNTPFASFDVIASIQFRLFFFWQVSARMSRFSGWLCCLIQVDLPCIFFHRSTLLSSWDPHREDCNGSGTLVVISRQHNDLFVGTVASPYLTNHVAHLLPCKERLCGTIAWGFIAWNHDVHSWTSIISD